MDPLARTIGLSEPGARLAVYEVGPGVHQCGDIRIGDRVHAKIAEVLTVYIAPAGEHAAAETSARSRWPDARVLTFDPSYRLLTVQYPDGKRETFKIALHTPMGGIEAGDFVAIHRPLVIELGVRRRCGRQQTFRPRAAPSA